MGIALFAWGAVLCLGAGRLVGSRLSPGGSALERAGRSLLFGILTASASSLLLFLLSGRPLTPASVTAATLAAALPLALSRRPPSPPLRHRPVRDAWAAAALVALVGAVYVAGTPHGAFHPQSARFSTSGRPFRFNDLAIGGFALRIPFTVFAFDAGEALPYVAFALLLASEGWSLGLELGGPAGGALLLLFLPLCSLVLSYRTFFYMFYACALSAACLALSLRARSVRAWCGVGAVLAAIWGVRPESVLFAPAILVLLRAERRRSGRSPWPAAAALLAAFALVGSPVLLQHRLVFGRMLVHESQEWSPLVRGGSCHPLYVHRVLGRTVCLHGLFQYPVRDHVVRTPGYPFPSFILMPLEVVGSMGLAIASLGLLPLLLPEGRRRALFLLAYLVPCLLLLGLSENWEPSKTSLLLMLVPAFAALPALGLGALLDRRDRRAAAALVACAAALALSLRAVEGLRFPVDDLYEPHTDLRHPDLYVEDEEALARRALELTLPPLLPRLPSVTPEGLFEPVFDRAATCTNATYCVEQAYARAGGLGQVIFVSDGPGQVEWP